MKRTRKIVAMLIMGLTVAMLTVTASASGAAASVPEISSLVTGATMSAILAEFIALVGVVFPAVLGFAVLKKAVRWIKGMVKGA
jgi:hypothetical protein